MAVALFLGPVEVPLACAASPDPVEIVVAPATGRDIGGYTDVQRIYGLMWGGTCLSALGRK